MVYAVTLMMNDLQRLRAGGHVQERQSWSIPDYRAILAKALPFRKFSRPTSPDAAPATPDVELIVTTTATTVTATRKMPTATYVAPDGLWGEWDSTTVDPFAAKETLSSEEPAPSHGTGVPHEAPHQSNGWSAVMTGIGAEAIQHRKGLREAAKHSIQRFVDVLLAILNFTL